MPATAQILVKPNQLDKKQAHWRAIAIKACQQSGRNMPPWISFFDNIQSLLNASCLSENKFLLDFHGSRLGTLLQSEIQPTQISIMVDPEGGLSATEIALATAAGFLSSQIGNRVLRIETAAITALAIAQLCWGDI